MNTMPKTVLCAAIFTFVGLANAACNLHSFSVGMEFPVAEAGKPDSCTSTLKSLYDVGIEAVTAQLLDDTPQIWVKASDHAPKAKSVLLEVLDQGVWATVGEGQALPATAAKGVYGDWGSFCGPSCYLVSVTPVLNGSERSGSLTEDRSSGQCHWVLPTVAQSAQGTCFGQTFRVSRV